MPPVHPASLRDKARALLTAIHTLHIVEEAKRPATPEERQLLSGYCGLGQLALHIFPDPVSGAYRDAGWQQLGEELHAILPVDDYVSARRTVFTAFYTSPVVIQALYTALHHFGVPDTATVLEPGCGVGSFMGYAPADMRFIGVELDSLSGRIARALHPQHDIRIENFRDMRLAEHSVDVVLGNVPFADLKVDYWGQRLSLHEFFLAKSLDTLKPSGVLALVMTHYFLDRLQSDFRGLISGRAALLGAIRLPAQAFQAEGTEVVTDLIFLQKRTAPFQDRSALEPMWMKTGTVTLDDTNVPINRYFLEHPELVLGTWTHAHRLYGADTSYSLDATGNLPLQLEAALQQLPRNVFCAAASPVLPPVQQALPPVGPQLGEGSFFVGGDHLLYQVQHGEAVGVIYSSKHLATKKPGMGRRIAELIDLRDAARRVLQTQHDGLEEYERQNARALLSGTYDAFVARYGPINKTTISITKEGQTIRRLPNLAVFRDDPDAMLVMALEHYDEEADTATKAAIFTEDVVSHLQETTTAQSAEEGLLVCLNQRGIVDILFIARLYSGSPRQVIEELGDLLYQDPITGEWQTADAYLSGNVRTKLAAARDAGEAFARNVEALRKVQPEDVLPGDIDANLGTPWIPVDVIHAFACMLFSVRDFHVKVAYNRKDATWSLDCSRWLKSSVPSTQEYGTERAGGFYLLELALNLRVPSIYDTFEADGKEQRVLNQQETLAAREKQRLIKERFKAWVFADPERAEHLVRIYNDTYNNIRLRKFDGSHLAFPGMNAVITLSQHQKDGVWRIISNGNTLLAHCVGAGKTFIMMAAAMKMQQAGLMHKPCFVVPNHMLEQFARECLQLYPNARLLMATKEDLTRERRKLLTAKIATGQWDGIITTHSSFERIGMSQDFQAQFLREQIAEYEALLEDDTRKDPDRAQKNIIKQLEKQKAKFEARLEALLAEEKKDDGLCFDELGIDYLFIDESQYSKNLTTPTKMEYVAGIQTQGSQRAFDLLMKARWLHTQHPGHGLTFATGTPVSNTMVELYTLQRYLDPTGLVERGIEHFDAWAATFGEVVEVMEISPDGRTLRPRQRFAKFVNLPELQQMIRQFADVQTADQIQLPRPELAGGKPTVIACPMSDTQRMLQDGLVERYEKVRAGQVKPWEDNALAITTDGRKLALDARMLTETATDYPRAKINALVQQVYTLWHETAERKATQLIFSDFGVHNTAWGFSAYNDIMTKLMQRGIPAAEIAAIGEADTDAKKHALFERVRAGSVRVLLGSTQKMGMGTNVQHRLYALHHLDAPWKPAEVEQRDGRILRQGNLHKDWGSPVYIFRYVTEGSFDAFMWQALETKARFIAQVMHGTSILRQAEDLADQALTYAEVKAIASGNPAVLTLAETDAELQRLRLLRKHHDDAQYMARQRLKYLPDNLTKDSARLEALIQDRETLAAHSTMDTFEMKDQPLTREQTLELLSVRLLSLPYVYLRYEDITLGTYRGLAFGLRIHAYGQPEVTFGNVITRTQLMDGRFKSANGVLHALDQLIASYDGEILQLTRTVEQAQQLITSYEVRIDTIFPHTEYAAALGMLRDDLRQALTAKEDSQEREAIPGIVAKIEALRGSHTAVSVSTPAIGQQAAPVEEAVTARIHARLQAARLHEQPDAPPLESIEPEPIIVPPPVVRRRAEHSTAQQLALF